MTRYLLDTNIISAATRVAPPAALIAWLDRQADADLFIAALTVAEIKRGILELEPGRRRRALEAWFAGPEGPQALFRGRVLSFDERAAAEWARLMAAGKAVGRPRSALDMIIASTAVIHDCIVATLNERHFEGAVEFINPSRSAT